MNPSTGAPSPRDFTALLCIDAPDLLETIRAPLLQLGFAVQAAPAVQEAITLLHAESFDVVAISETFCGADAHTHPILTELSELPLDVRRDFFVVLYGAGRNAASSEMEAFSLSVDLLVGPQDLPNLSGLIGRGLSRHDAFYAAYHAAAKRLGKE